MMQSTSNNDDGEYAVPPSQEKPLMQQVLKLISDDVGDPSFRAQVADLLHLCRLNLGNFDRRDRQTLEHVMFSLQGKQRRFEHVKTKGVYIYFGDHLRESDCEVMALYQSVTDRQTWSRPRSEFFDGRFKELP